MIRFLLGSEMSSDDRAFLMQAVLSLNLEGTVTFLYPRLYALVSNLRISIQTRIQFDTGDVFVEYYPKFFHHSTAVSDVRIEVSSWHEGAKSKFRFDLNHQLARNRVHNQLCF